MMAQARSVEVPDLIGQPVDIASEKAADVGLVLSGGDLDGPSLRSRTWPGLFWVTTQNPPPGAVVSWGSRVQVSFIEDGETRSDIPAQRGGPQPSLEMHADAAEDGRTTSEEN